MKPTFSNVNKLNPCLDNEMFSLDVGGVGKNRR